MTAPSPVCHVAAILMSKKRRSSPWWYKVCPWQPTSSTLHAKSALRREHGVGVKFAQQKIKPRQISHARLVGIHRRQHCRANFATDKETPRGREVRQWGAGAPARELPRLLNAERDQTSRHDPHHRHINPVCRSSAHHSSHDHLVSCSCARRRFSLPRRSKLPAAPARRIPTSCASASLLSLPMGAFGIRRILAHFLLNASIRFADSLHAGRNACHSLRRFPEPRKPA